MGELARIAERIARVAHEGQVDKSGAPYAEHPARVAAGVRADGQPDDDRAVAVAWLHDVVEDTPVTLADLAEHFPADVVEAVDAVTHREGESSETYYARVRANALALRVKAADLADNSSPARLAALDEATRNRLRDKYSHARQTLGIS